MRRNCQGGGAILFALIFLITASTTATASIGPLWSDAQLADFSDVVVTGSVVEVRSGWDRTVNSIYTYVTVDVDDVWKGTLGTDRVTIKQLGGVADDIGLAVADQPTFEVGEEVLLFLEVRPRDRTLYTAALWQGKWSIESGLSGRVATRVEPGQSANVERRGLAALGEAVRAAGPDADAATSFQTQPPEAFIAEPFVLISTTTPYRFFFNPLVNVQSGGQPGLAGGGFSQIGNSITRWNAVSPFQFGAGTTSGPRCTSTFLGNSRVTMSFMDPCAEMSNSGGTLALGGAYFNPNTGTVVNGVTFRTAVEGFVVNNDSTAALNFMTNSGCFSDIQLHELGHVLGLGHSADNTAVMFASVSFATCSANAGGRNLAADDIAGGQFIYPTTGQAPGTPTVTSAGASGGNLTVIWTSGAGGAPTAHRLDFFQGAALVAQLNTGAGTSAVIPLPAGIVGSFGVRVTAGNAAGASAASAILAFNIGVNPPGQPTVTSAVASGGVLTVVWTSGAGAAPTSHLLAFYQGAALVAQLPVGAGTSAAIPLPAGVSGTFGVRVTAFNGAINGPTSNLFTFSIGPACTIPGTPNVTGSFVGGVATVSWGAVAGAASYLVSAGTTQGGQQLVPLTNFGPATGVQASGLPAGFTAWVRVIAVNACGQQGPPRDYFLQ